VVNKYDKIVGIVFLLLLSLSPAWGASPTVVDSGQDELRRQIELLRSDLERMQAEADARKQLTATAKEKEATGKEVLSAVGRQYTLLPQGILALEYKFSYAYFSYDVLREATSIEHRSNHTLTNTLTTEYALRDNLTLNANLPFVYKYDRAGSDQQRTVTDFGSISFGAQWQPFKAGGDFPTTILTGALTTATGRSPYEINADKDLATGSGNYSLTGGATFSETLDPLVAFGSLSYTHNFDVVDLQQHRSGGRILEEVELGDSIGLGLGIGYALSYRANLNLSLQYSFGFGNTYRFSNAPSSKSGTTTSAQFTLGSGWNLSSQRTLNLALGVGLTNDDPDFTFTVRLPFEFQLENDTPPDVGSEEGG